MDISAIIVNYKSINKTMTCIQSIKESDVGDLKLEIIVVENNSGDDTEIIKNSYPEVKIIKSEKNVGMGGGNNLGIKNSSGEFILILNPDTRIKSGLVSLMHRHINDRKDVGVVGPKLLNPDNTLQYSCLRFPKVYTPIFRRTFLSKIGKKHLDHFLMKDFDHSQTREVDWVIGSCLMIRRSVLDKMKNIFNEKFFMYFEDTDFCRRLKKHNLKVVYYPNAVAIHDHLRQSAEQSWYIAPFVNRLTREHLKSWFKYFI